MSSALGTSKEIELERVLTRIGDKTNSKHICVAFKQGDKFDLKQFSNNGHLFQGKTVIPIFQLSEFLISGCFKYLINDTDQYLNKPITTLVPYISIKEAEFSMRYTLLKYLFTHSSGLADIRSLDELIYPDKFNITLPTNKLSLHKYFTFEFQQQISPNSSYYSSPINYTLIAAFLEFEFRRPFSSLMREFLTSLGLDIDIYSLKQDINFENRISLPYYPTQKAYMSIKEFLDVSQIIASEVYHETEIGKFITKEQFIPIDGLDPISRPFRKRRINNIDIYIHQSQNQSNTLLHAIIPDISLSVLVIMQESETSQTPYYCNYILKQLLVELDLFDRSFPDYQPLQLSNEQIKPIEGRYRQKKIGLLDQNFVFDFGGEIIIEQKSNQLFLRDQLYGIFKKRSPISVPKLLVPVEMSGSKLILGYFDGLYFSKVIVPQMKGASYIYTEISGPKSLFIANSTTNPLRYSVVLHLHYAIKRGIIPLVHGLNYYFKQFLQTFQKMINNLYSNRSNYYNWVKERISLFFSKTRYVLNRIYLRGSFLLKPYIKKLNKLLKSKVPNVSSTIIRLYKKLYYNMKQRLVLINQQSEN